MTTRGTIVCKRIEVRGTVQGVGFRPFVYRLAHETGLAGGVKNFPGGVDIRVEGEAGRVDEFIARVRTDAPPLARIREVRVAECEPSGAGEFRIDATDAAGATEVDAARDTATCAKCLAELRDPADRRFRHPFINCTECGPRYTIIESLPYDRPATSMKAFPMCASCGREYREPADRRFHAQPVCCRECGPTLRALDADGRQIESADPIGAAVEALRAGRIAAVKGIGGFHLACDATSSEAVRRLRQRKHREEKPLAVMARDIEGIRRVASVSPAERALLEGPERPIVLLGKAGEGTLAEEVDPRSRTHGMMLPYTPIHHLLLDSLPYLVMTSGNRTEEPIARTNEEAVSRLRGIADIFLVHDREILTRNDDSVVCEAAGDVMMLRRSRGYVPEPIDCGEEVDGLVACGAMLKNCIAVGRGRSAYLSQHIGDLTNVETYRSLEASAGKLSRLLGVHIRRAACDMHPGYPSTRFAESLGVPVVRVQHHHAHIVACMAENGLHGRVIGVAWDGTGYGMDGHIWGSEVMLSDRDGFETFGRLSYMRMPGGDAAVKNPGRMAMGALFPLMGRDAARAVPDMPGDEAAAVFDLLRSGTSTPLTRGMGRLFDAASAVLGVCTRATYEGQPAAELEGVTNASERDGYDILLQDVNGDMTADSGRILAAVVEDRGRGTPVPVVAARFHNTIVDLLVKWCRAARDRTSLADVCLSGGCFQNAFLLERSVARLEEAGFRVHRHRLVPPNDGGVALGQIVAAARAKEAE